MTHPVYMQPTIVLQLLQQFTILREPMAQPSPPHNFLTPHVPTRINEGIFSMFDDSRSHLNIIVSLEFQDRFHVVMLPPYCPFLNPVEQAHSCLKSEIKQHLVLPHIQAEILHIQNTQVEAGLNQQQWRANVLLRIVNDALQQITHWKSANWCARILQYIPASPN